MKQIFASFKTITVGYDTVEAEDAYEVWNILIHSSDW